MGVVFVSFSVVMPTEQLQIREIGGAVVGWRPVFDVVGFATFGGLLAAGGLAVLVAYDECFPLGG